MCGSRLLPEVLAMSATKYHHLCGSLPPWFHLIAHPNVLIQILLCHLNLGIDRIISTGKKKNKKNLSTWNDFSRSSCCALSDKVSRHHLSLCLPSFHPILQRLLWTNVLHMEDTAIMQCHVCIQCLWCCLREGAPVAFSWDLSNIGQANVCNWLSLLEQQHVGFSSKQHW